MLHALAAVDAERSSRGWLGLAFIAHALARKAVEVMFALRRLLMQSPVNDVPAVRVWAELVCPPATYIMQNPKKINLVSGRS